VPFRNSDKISKTTGEQEEALKSLQFGTAKNGKKLRRKEQGSATIGAVVE